MKQHKQIFSILFLRLQQQQHTIKQMQKQTIKQTNPTKLIKKLQRIRTENW